MEFFTISVLVAYIWLCTSITDEKVSKVEKKLERVEALLESLIIQTEKGNND